MKTGDNKSGLLFEDLDAFDLVNIPVKRTDTRAAKYLAEFGDRAAELDALPPNILQGRIRSAIRSCIDDAEWERIEQVERLERESLSMVVRNWPLAVAAVNANGVAT